MRQVQDPSGATWPASPAGEVTICILIDDALLDNFFLTGSDIRQGSITA